MATAVRATFEKRLAQLGNSVLQLGMMARHAVGLSLAALDDGNVESAREVIAEDVAINGLRFYVENQCHALIAMEQPVAGDLRTIVAALTVSADLERIGDHGKKIAKVALGMADTPRPLFVGAIPRMGALSLSMLDRALGAMSTRDVTEARSVCEVDDQLDALYKESFNLFLTRMIEERHAIGAGTHLIQVAHELERVGDRATNIAERVIYTVTGELTDLNV
jgi:phosphate transport system protein